MASSLPETRSPGKPEFTLSSAPSTASDLAKPGIACTSFTQAGEKMTRFTPKITALFRLFVTSAWWTDGGV
jgi:hypothetical protein